MSMRNRSGRPHGGKLFSPKFQNALRSPRPLPGAGATYLINGAAAAYAADLSTGAAAYAADLSTGAADLSTGAAASGAEADNDASSAYPNGAADLSTGPAAAAGAECDADAATSSDDADAVSASDDADADHVSASDDTGSASDDHTAASDASASSDDADAVSVSSPDDYTVSASDHTVYVADASNSAAAATSTPRGSASATDGRDRDGLVSPLQCHCISASMGAGARPQCSAPEKSDEVGSRSCDSAAATLRHHRPRAISTASTVAIEKLGSWFALAFPVIWSTMPFLYGLYTRSFQKTLNLFGTPAMLASLASSVLWLLYSAVVVKKDPNVDLLLSNALLCMASFDYLICAYTHLGAIRKGILLGISFIISLSIIFGVMHCDQNPSELMIQILGGAGLLALFFCHGILILDILQKTIHKSQKIVTFANLIPSCVGNLGTLYLTFQNHPDHVFVLISSSVGFSLNIIEILLLLIVVMRDYFSASSQYKNEDIELQPDDDEATSTSNVSEASSEDYFPASSQPNEDTELAHDVSEATSQEIAAVQDASADSPEERIKNAAAGSSQEEHHLSGEIGTGATQVEPQQQATCVIILQRPEGYEIIAIRDEIRVDVHIRARLVQAIPRIMLGIERDIYIPMLLLASGIAATTEPNMALIRRLECRYRMLVNRALIRRLECRYRMLVYRATTSHAAPRTLTAMGSVIGQKGFSKRGVVVDNIIES
ncbi:hypothetical protein ACP4OV_011905 [Aristida adscensionis]